MSKADDSMERELLQRLVNIVGDCESTDKLLELVDDVEKWLNPRSCSFCKRTEHEVKHLVVTGTGSDVAICSLCVDIVKGCIPVDDDEQG